jgi:hypothetical protein
MHPLKAVAGATTAAAALAASFVVVAEEQSPHISIESAEQSASHEPIRDFTGKPEKELELSKLRLREGTRLKDVAGRFRISGDALTFIDADGREITGLCNLNLERILRMLKTVEEPESITWSVSGTVTEFSGRNYLLVSRAVYKAAAPPPAPETISQPQAAAAPALPAATDDH